MRRTAGVVLILAAILISLPMGLGGFATWAATSQVWTKVENSLINNVYGNIRDVCTETLGDLCGSMLIHPGRFETKLKQVIGKIERGNLKADLKVPTLNIYTSEGVWHELSERRNKAFHSGGAAYGDGLKDWFNAEIVSEIDQKIVKVRLRLKGKEIDHVDDRLRMSLRVRVKNDDQLLGMSEFSIHKPGVRMGTVGAIGQDVMKRFGVLAAGTIFADVRINNEFVGIMGLEEYFTKEMLEAQGRRNSVVVAVDEDWTYQQRFLNREIGRDYSELRKDLYATLEWDKWSGRDLLTPLSLRDFPIQVYNAGQASTDATATQTTVDAVSMFRDVIDGRLSGSAVYDYNQLARFWIIVHMFSGQHGMLFSDNRRDYFNPISRRLEPVSYDLNARPNYPCLSNGDWMSYAHWEYPCVVSDPSIRSIWDDPSFIEIFWNEANTIQERINDPRFKEWLSFKYKRYDQILSIDAIRRADLLCPSCEDSIPEWQEPGLLTEHAKGYMLNAQLQKNLTDFLLRVREKKPFQINGSTSLDIKQKENVVDDIVTQGNQEIMKHLELLHTHIRPFYSKSSGKIAVEVKNLTLDPVFIHSVFSDQDPSINLLPLGVAIPSYVPGSVGHIFQIDIPRSTRVANESLWIQYDHKAKPYSRPMISQHRDYQTDYEGDEDTLVWFKNNGVYVNEEKRSISFGPGRYSLKSSIQTKRGWQVKFSAGAVLEFKQGARLRVNGPVQLLGNIDAPVELHIEPGFDHSRKSWGGLLVVNAAAHSRLRHVLVTSSNKRKIGERQDANGLTGCITFFKSNLSIRNVRFSGLHCEDALNVVHSKFDFEHLEISDSKADALDCDFSDGKIINSTFRNNQNDDLDLSGSDVNLRSSTFVNSGDKAISVGEGSILEAGNIKVTGSTAGVVSKDQSVINIHNLFLTGVNTGLMAYIKKPEWGPATLNCQNCSFKDVKSIAVKQNGSTIVIGSNEVGISPFSREQLRIAGYL